MIEKEIIHQLSDGKFHSGQLLAQRLGLSRTAIWKQIGRLKQMGATIFSVPGKGYQIPGGLDVLDLAEIKRELMDLLPGDDQVLLFNRIASTNAFFMSQIFPRYPTVCFAEYQFSGRGRRGRDWHSPFARNLYFSLALTLPVGRDLISGLSLAVGCSMANYLKSMGVTEIQLKWPNDLRLNGAKVGGILVELGKIQKDSCDVVIGVGLNWDMPKSESVSQLWENLKPYFKREISRSVLAGQASRSLVKDIQLFSDKGFKGFQEQWQEFDEFLDKEVELHLGNDVLRGIYQGVTDKGELKLLTDKGEQILSGGEISLRVAQ